MVRRGDGNGARPLPGPLPALLGALLLLVTGTAAAPAPAAADPAARAARLDALRTALDAKRRHAPALLGRPGVVGVGVGLDPDGRAVVRVWAAGPGRPAVPAHLDGIPVRVRVTGRVHALRGATCEAAGDGVCGTDERWPLPVPIGVSVGHPAITAGTIGARVTDGADVYLLSNNHVLADSNAASPGDAALQPGPFDGGSAAGGDAIATLHDFEPIAFCERSGFLPLCSQTNAFDAAIARSSPAELGFATPDGTFGSPVGYGAPSPALHPAYGDPAVLGDEDLAALQGVAVQKMGRTTDLTTGSVDTVGLTVDVCYDPFCGLLARFEDQLSIGGPFSDGGDSGSLVVTDDAASRPVALLFAGTDTESVVSRIDLVLLRFGVDIDDAGTSSPVTDAELEALAPPSWALAGQTATVSVTVRNRGTEPLAAFDVELADATEATASTLAAPPLAPGVRAQLDFAWTPAVTGPHTLTATLQLADDEPGNDAAGAEVPVLLEPPGLSLRLWSGTARTDAWTPVTLDVDYGTDMVVVCTPQYDVSALGPLVARVRNARDDGFEVGLGRPWFGAFPGEEGSAEVQCLVARAGVYPGAQAGVPMEVVRLDGFSAKDDAYGWTGQARAYAQAYTRPVVVGQVISPGGGGPPGEIGAWSAFWARGPTPFDPPSPAALFVGRHTGEDPEARAPETLAYVVVEAGLGAMDGHAFVADVGPETVRGVDDAPPHVYALPDFLGAASAAVASSAGMDGLEGGWPILYGAGAVQPRQLGLAIEEDWFFDPERSHTTEQVGYVVFGVRATRSCGLGFELALLAPVLARWRRARLRRRGA